MAISMATTVAARKAKVREREKARGIRRSSLGARGLLVESGKAGLHSSLVARDSSCVYRIAYCGAVGDLGDGFCEILWIKFLDRRVGLG